MKRLTNLTLIFGIALLFVSWYSSKVDFKPYSPSKAMEHAASEGKLVIINFTANWCQACKMMDDYTYTDPDVIALMNKSYIPIKVDIDDFDGIVWKQKYNVRVLPTILIFNSAGKQLARYEEGLPGSKLTKILKDLDVPQNKTKTSSNQSSSTSGSTSSTAASSNSNTTTNSTSSSSSNTGPFEPKISTAGEGMFEFVVKQQNNLRGFGIQIGVFADYANVLKEIEKISSRLNAKTYVNINKLNSKIVYKVVVGKFDTSAKAESFKIELKKIGLDGFVKDLSSYK